MTQRRHTIANLLAMVCLGFGGTSLRAEPPAVPELSPDQVAAWMTELSNWGRWGEGDQLGTLNLITPAKRVQAAGLVTSGKTVSMALELNKIKGPLNANPFEHKLTVGTFGGHQVAGDAYAVDYHGFAHSHMDGLPHFLYQEKMYNGFGVDELKPDGARKLGIHNAGNGIVTRGVLVDMPLLKGVRFLEPGTPIFADDLEAWEKRTGITIGSGDVLLIRTGRWTRVDVEGPWDFIASAAGLHASVAPWLKSRDVAMLGSDGVNDVMPSGAGELFNPLHQIVLIALGMPLFDNLDLDALATEAAASKRWEFMFFAAPLKIRGGTGSPLNPIAVF